MQSQQEVIRVEQFPQRVRSEAIDDRDDERATAELRVGQQRVGERRARPLEAVEDEEDVGGIRLDYRPHLSLAELARGRRALLHDGLRQVGAAAHAPQLDTHDEFVARDRR